ncbi:MAG: ArnT family glycosyltransferase [Bacteroidales bacterium]
MRQKLTYAVLIIVLIGALFQNLGKLPLIDDEGLRGLIALDMKFQGDLITPATAGEYYFNKPPLYNWIILFFINLFGTASEFVLRLPMVLSLLGFTATIFFYLKRHFRNETALLTALFFLTSGRVLFYESLHGLIDITFSWVIFLQIICLYEFFRQGKYREMFLLSYLLAAIGFLLKGMPVVPFQGITLLVILIMNKSLKTFFNRWHFAGIGLFIVLVGSYFYAYYLKNPEMLDDYLTTLVFQSTSRTLFANSIVKVLAHISLYPFEMIFHFLPWSLLIILMFSRSVRKGICKDKRQLFFLMAFFFNILVYWLSPISYPRYILMLIPLGLAPLVDQFVRQENRFAEKFSSWFLWVISGVVILAIPAIMVFNFFEAFQDVPGLLVKTIAIILVLTFLMYKFFRNPSLQVYIVVLVMLVGRIGYNSIISIERHQSNMNVVVEESRKIAEITRGEPLYSYYDPEIDDEHYHGRIKHRYTAHFYLQRFKNDLIPIKTTFEKDGFYLITQKHLSKFDVDLYATYEYHPGYRLKYLVKKKQKFAF